MKQLHFVLRRSKRSSTGKHALNLGLSVGYWPCVKGVYVRLLLGSWIAESWYGHAGYKYAYPEGAWEGTP